MSTITKVGFTSTRHGLTDHQHTTLAALLRSFLREGIEFHHGQCRGGDAEGARLAKVMGYRIVSHPPKNPTLRSTVAADEVRPPEDYLVRNRLVVDEVDVLVAAPFEASEVLRSGSWATIRYARRRWPEKLLIVLKPMPAP